MAKRDYTFGHGGRMVRVGPVAFWIVVGTLVVMASWSLVTATYFAFHDDVITRMVAREAQMQFGYEDRIADLRAQIDRVTGRQLLDQEQFDKKLDQIVRRQTALESRAATLGATLGADPTPTGSIRPAARGISFTEPAEPTLPSALKPAPINDTVIFMPPPDRQARLESRGPALPAPATRTAALDSRAGGFDGIVNRLQTSLDQVEARQLATLNTLEENLDGRARRLRDVFTDLGLDANRIAGSAARGVGGPFVPAKLSGDGSFERQLYRVNVVRNQVDTLNRSLVKVPIRKPIDGEIELTSGFGVRSDPFLGRPAMHTGQDFRGAMGDPVRATASGTVTSASWAGGYGRMVEIDHGNGLATRYGHMSQIAVHVGDAVKIGQIVGRVGSTGRSTGPHLHYETRIAGEAVDPQKFLRAGIRLFSGS